MVFNNETLDKLDDATKAEIQKLLDEKVTPVVSNKDKIMTDYTNLKKSVDELGDLEEVKKLIKNHEAELERARKEAYDKAKEEGDVKTIESTYKKQLEAKDKAYTDLQSAMLNTHLNGELAAAIAAAKGNTKVLPEVVKNRVKAELVDGKPVVKVLDENGEQKVLEGGNTATLKDLMAELKSSDDYKGLFNVSVPSGSNLRQSQGTGSASNPFETDDKGNRDWDGIAKIWETDPDRAKALQEEAGISTI